VDVQTHNSLIQALVRLNLGNRVDVMYVLDYAIPASGLLQVP
jgi:hypothetical protein